MKSDNPIPIHRILAWAERSPSSLALQDQNHSLNYLQLKQVVTTQAQNILPSFISGREKRVIVLSEGSAEMVIAILATQLAGGAYIPIEPKVPFERIKAIYEAARPALLVYDTNQTNLARQLAVELGMPHLHCNLTSLLQSSHSPQTLLPQLLPSTPAVVFFTSGSTGTPKGVELAHYGYQAWYEGIQDCFTVEPGDRVALAANHSFDLSLGELLLGLVSGATLVVPTQSVVRDLLNFVPWVEENCITIWQAVPSLMRMLLQFHQSSARLQNLRILMLCGEALEVALVRKFYMSFPQTQAKAINLYGPVEASIQVSWCWAGEYISSDLVNVPIGKALKHAVIDMIPLDDSSCHQLVIKGPHLALRYLDSDKTREAFIEDVDTPRYYKTGDLAVRNERGDLEYLGRIDHQVKINGYRIELSEIEYALINSADVEDACVVAIAKGAEQELVAFIVAKEISVPEIRGKLSSTLPLYMLPKRFVFLEQLPLTDNGKRDRVKMIRELGK
jgi:D-alanine--poly(phosphoribitol) ligase subunit 1